MSANDFFVNNIQRALANGLSAESKSDLSPLETFEHILSDAFTNDDDDSLEIQCRLIKIILKEPGEGLDLPSAMKSAFNLLTYYDGGETELLRMDFRRGTDKLETKYEAFEPEIEEKTEETNLN